VSPSLPPSPRLRDLKAAAQRLEPCLKLGKAGVTDAFLAALGQALDHHQLVKVKFDAFKEEKKVLAPAIAQRTSSQLVQRVGNVAVYYRRREG
jgi:RNA-binding protein